MKPFVNFTSNVSYLPFDNIDTDQLINARFMKETRKPVGYGRFLFHDFNRDLLKDGAEIIVAGRNFGCGSSREAAVYALIDYGIKCVIAPSFGDIFANNAVKNGLLLISTTKQMPQEPLSIDLEKQLINSNISFDIEASSKAQLISGHDEIAYTMQFMPIIDRFIENYG